MATGRCLLTWRRTTSSRGAASNSGAVDGKRWRASASRPFPIAPVSLQMTVLVAPYANGVPASLSALSEENRRRQNGGNLILPCGRLLSGCERLKQAELRGCGGRRFETLPNRQSLRSRTFCPPRQRTRIRVNRGRPGAPTINAWISACSAAERFVRCTTA
jgi:hypothetical protein